MRHRGESLKFATFLEIDERKGEGSLEKIKKLPKIDEKTIRNDLVEQLKKREMDTPIYLGLVEDYIRFYKMALTLYDDIEDRGVSVEWRNSPTSNGFKKNESISEYVKVNMQMLKILGELGLRGANIEVAEPDETL